jgi:hypothetical protein
MNYKTVYQTDINGVYTNTTTAYESPLEPGVFLIPAGAVEIVPPIAEYNQYAQWNGSQWNIIDFIPEVTPISELTWSDIKLQRNVLLAASDWTDLPNTPLTNKQAWLDYRQTLRNIPQVYSEPSQVVWPLKP